MATEENKALIRRWIEEVWNRGNLAAVDELFAPGYAVNGQVVGSDSVSQAVTWLRAAFPDARTSVEALVAEGDQVVVGWAMRGTHQGTFMDVAPTGREVTLAGINIYRIADGRIVENRESVDVLGLLRQLGATITPPAPAPARCSR